MMRARALTWLVGLLLIAATSEAKVVVLDSCDQVLDRGGAAMLMADLDCSGSAAFQAVWLDRGRVILNGFTLTAPSGGVALRCEQRCKIAGPGTIVGGVLLGAGRYIRVSDTTMTGNGGTAFKGGSVRLIRVTIAGFDSGLYAADLAKVFDSTLIGTGQPGRGIAGAGSALVKLRNSSVSGFGDIGISNYDRLQLIDSAVTGNGVSASCSGFCGDLATEERPVLLGTSSCGTSWDTIHNVSWGVCAND